MKKLSDTSILDEGVEESQTPDLAGSEESKASQETPLTLPTENENQSKQGFFNLAPEVKESKSSLEQAQAEELAQLRRRASDLEVAYQAALRERELAKALAGRPLVPGAVAQLIKLWNSDLDVFEESGAYKVVSRDGRPVSEAVADWLSQPDYAHFCRPTSRGGTTKPGTNRSLADSSVPSRPLSLGEMVLQRWRDSSVARTEIGSISNGFGRNR